MLGGYGETWGLKDTEKKKKIHVPECSHSHHPGASPQFSSIATEGQIPKVILTWDFFLLLDPISLYHILPKPLCSVEIKFIFKKHPYIFNFFANHLLHFFAFIKSLSVPRRVLCKQMLKWSLACRVLVKDQTPRKEGRESRVGQREMLGVPFLSLGEAAFCSFQFSYSVVSSCLRPYGLQHPRLPCPSPPGACSNSCPSSRWCHPTISSSVVPFSSCLQSFPASEGVTNLTHNQCSWEAPTCERIQGKLGKGKMGRVRMWGGGEGAEMLRLPRPLCDHVPWGMAQDWQYSWILRAQASKSDWSSFKSWLCQVLTMWLCGWQSVFQCSGFPIPIVSTRQDLFFVDLLGELNKVPVRTYMPGTENTQEFVDYC